MRSVADSHGYRLPIRREWMPETADRITFEYTSPGRDFCTFVLLYFCLLAGAEPSCEDGADANDDGFVNISDVIFTTNVLFRGAPMPAPYEDCATDPTADGLGCSSDARGCD